MDSPYIPTYHDLNVSFTGPTSSGEASVHYVEAGNAHFPTLLLMHGFPSSSYEFRDLIPMVSDRYHVLAPDFPGFGLTTVANDFKFTFGNLAAVIAAWLAALNLTSFAMYIHDYGAPIGLRIALQNPAHVVGIITQNGNAYEAGFGQAFWAPIFAIWNSSNSQASRDFVAKNALTLAAIEDQYVQGTPEKDKALLDPSAWNFNFLQNIASASKTKTQLDLFYDYRTNVEMYPEFQEYFRSSKVPILVVWGEDDPAFIPAGAEAFKKDSPGAIVHFVDAGHFALETKRWEIVRLMRAFLTGIGF